MVRATRLACRTLAIAIVGLLAACGSQVETTNDDGQSAQGPEPAARRFDRPVRWESGLLEDLGHSFTIVFTGGQEGDLESNPCAGEYEAEVEEAADSVTITLYSLALVAPPDLGDDFGCDAVGYERRVGVSIGGDGLGDRTVIDGSTGEQRTLIDETSILMPTSLPEEWMELYRGPSGPAMEFAYGPDPDTFPALTYLAVPTDNGFYNMDDDTLDWDLTTLEEIGVRGNESGAVLITSQEDGARTFVFEEGGRHHRVTLQAGVDIAIGYAFIDSLR